MRSPATNSSSSFRLIRLCAYRPSRINSPAEARRASLSLSPSPSFLVRQQVLNSGELLDHLMCRLILFKPQRAAEFEPLDHLPQIDRVEIGTIDLADGVAN